MPRGSLVESDSEKPAPLLMYDFDVKQQRLVLKTQEEDAFKVYVKEIVDVQSEGAFVSARRFGALHALVDPELSLHALIEVKLLTDKQGIVWRSEGHEWIGAYVARQYPGELVIGQICQWVPPDEDDPRAMWKMKHPDGDAEDFFQNEVEKAIELYQVENCSSMWKSEGHTWIGESVARVSDVSDTREVIVGKIWRWLPVDEKHPIELWKMVHPDVHDIEDPDIDGRLVLDVLDEEEVKEAIKLYKAQQVGQGAGKKHKLDASQDGSSSRKPSKRPRGRTPQNHTWDDQLACWVDANGNLRQPKGKGSATKAKEKQQQEEPENVTSDDEKAFGEKAFANFQAACRRRRSSSRRSPRTRHE